MTIIWLKFIHVGSISLWCAGLIGLPALYGQRVRLRDKAALFTLQGSVRFSYLALISPAAFIAVGSGIALVFVAETFVPWFSLKLAVVGMLVGLHLLTGLIIVRLFDDGEDYPVWRFGAVAGVSLLATLAILFLVLAKPSLPLDALPDAISRPGALRELFVPLLRWTGLEAGL